ncbi:hypothetical protein CEXT_324431 [Caerostris extrusa]|uniref:Uncharacterized protein n=1 Tax=Caerostris extrusa TaxID=172846 RepID=A0AAV4UTA5_CAEEX|nr:hypothetical protein CEXT_324431 [Caerostris extrusa]
MESTVMQPFPNATDKDRCGLHLDYFFRFRCNVTPKIHTTWRPKAHPMQLPEAGNPCAGDQFIPYANEVERQKATDEKCQRRLGLIVTTPIVPPLCDPRSL